MLGVSNIIIYRYTVLALDKNAVVIKFGFYFLIPLATN